MHSFNITVFLEENQRILKTLSGCRFLKETKTFPNKYSHADSTDFVCLSDMKEFVQIQHNQKY